MSYMIRWLLKKWYLKKYWKVGDKVKGIYADRDNPDIYTVIATEPHDKDTNFLLFVEGGTYFHSAKWVPATMASDESEK